MVADKVRVGPIVCAPPDRRGLDTLAEILEPMGEGTICGHSLLWPRALLAKVPWDERLSANGDSDFFGRAILAGAQIVGRPVGMAYYRVHQGERVSSATALRRPMSAAQYRLKWSQLLLSHPEHEIFAPAMRNGFMALLIALVRPAGSARAGADPERCLLVVGRRGLLRLQPAGQSVQARRSRPAPCGSAGHPGCIGC